MLHGAAADYDNSTKVAHLGRMAQRTYNVENIIALFEGIAQMLGSVAYCLYD